MSVDDLAERFVAGMTRNQWQGLDRILDDIGAPRRAVVTGRMPGGSYLLVQDDAGIDHACMEINNCYSAVKNGDSGTIVQDGDEVRFSPRHPPIADRFE